MSAGRSSQTDATAYVLKRQSGGAANSTINRELAVLTRMLRLAYEHQDAGRPAYIVTAASQEMCELVATVLQFDGGIGTRAERQQRMA